MTKPPSPRPLSIKLIAVRYFFMTLRGVAYIRPHAAILIFSVHGSPAYLWRLVEVSLLCYLSIGIWRLRPMARRMGMLVEAYYVLQLLLMNSVMSVKSRLVENLMQDAMSPQTASTALLSQSAAYAVASGLVIWFLIKRKAAFGKRAATTPTRREE